ncbi:type III secretion system inner rod subunit SctI [Arsenophonus sp. ENCA]|uniref:type III secretion system inner rod subunit SctI n=1 Tax=Arsenophonus sp. ENCA TaxID=1987579 RepID=UPI0025BA5B14|nr:type III secretion system inner rod subunit SctI [Arsenophonus sp. ENCA]
MMKTQAAETVNPDSQLVEKFNQLMQHSQGQTAALGSVLPSTVEPMAQALSPTQAVQGQAMIVKAVLEVDMAAKTAGSLAQSINKLVAMQ